MHPLTHTHTHTHTHTQSQFKDSQKRVEDGNRARDELAAKQRDLEKKVKSLEADLVQSMEEKSNAERARRAAEADRDDLQDEVSSYSSKA